MTEKPEERVESISIHALLAESDNLKCRYLPECNHFYPRSPCGERLGLGAVICNRPNISIHALLAESDTQHVVLGCNDRHFYPRSPCGERRAPPYNLMILQAFLSTLSLRRATVDCQQSKARNPLFLSTLSLRRATYSFAACSCFLIFLSTLSLRRATRRKNAYPKQNIISIHALLAESDP